MLALKWALGLRGKVEYLDENLCLSVVGNALQFLQLKTGERHFVHGRGFGISTFAVSARKRVFAYGEKRPFPCVYVHAIDDEKLLLRTLEGSAEVEHADLAFSQDGVRLASIAKLPDFSIVVWDWERQQKLVQAKLSAPCQSLSFNPRDQNELCSSGLGHVMIWTIERELDQHVLTCRDIANISEGRAFSHKWSHKEGELLVGCTGGHLALYQSGRDSLIPLRAHEPISASTITSLVCTSENVVVGCQDGSIKWVEVTPLGTVVICGSGMSPDAAAVVHGSLSPDFKSFMFGTASGASYILHVQGNIPGPGTSTPSSIFTKIECIMPPYGTTSNVIAALHTSQHIASAAEDGSLQIFKLSSKPGDSRVSCTSFPGSLLSIQAHPACPTVALGSRSGVLRILDVSDVGKPHLLFRIKLHKAPLRQLCFSNDGIYLVTGSNDEMVFFLEVQDGHRCRPLGYVPVSGTISSMQWVAFEDLRPPVIYIATLEGELIEVQAPSLSHDPQGKFCLPQHVAPRRRLIIPKPVHSLSWCPGSDSWSPGSLFSLGSDKMLREIDIPEFDPELARMVPDEPSTTGVAAADDPFITGLNVSSTAVHASLREHTVHEKGGGVVVSCRKSRLIASAGADGQAILRHRDHPAERKFSCRSHDPLMGQISSIIATPDERFLVSCGTDGSLFCYEVPPSLLREQALATISWPNNFERPVIKDDEQEEQELTFLEGELKNQREVEDAIYTTARNKARNAVRKLRQKLLAALSANNAAPELEKLRRQEFIVDIEERERRIKEAEEQVIQTREAIKLEDLARDLIWSRIKQECWDSMAVQGMSVCSLLGATEVNNYPMRHLSASEAGLQASVDQLLLSELCDGDLLKERESITEFASRISRVLCPPSPTSTGSQPQSQQQGNGISQDPNGRPDAEDKEESGDSSAAPKVDMVEGPAWLADAALQSSGQKRTQIYVLQAMIQSLKTRFNQRCEDLLARKRLEIEKVHEKAERMRSIIDEIRKLDPVNHDLDSYKDDIFLPNLSEAEEPHRTLVVSDAEVHVEKVLSEEEQRRIELERQRAAERAKMEAGDDFALRALNEMMGGTLNAPTKETSAIEDIIRPSFMDDVPAEDWTEEQQKEAKEYEAKDKALREEREKAKKTLEAELKKCKQEVTEQCAKFDEAVQQLFELRISVDQSIFQNELFIIKLSMALLQDEEDEIQERKLVELVEELGKNRMRTASAVSDFKRAYDECRAGLEALIQEDKAFDRNFKRDLPPEVDEQTAGELFRIFRKRHAKGHVGHSTRGKDAASNAPLSSHRGSVENSKTTHRKPLQSSRTHAGGVTSSQDASDAYDAASVMDSLPDPLEAKDRPANVSDDVWSHVVAYREKKIETEVEIKRRSVTIAEMQQRLFFLSEDDERVRDSHEQALQQLRDLQEERAREAIDLELLCKLKQGQVEVEQAAVVTDYADGVLVQRSVVVDLNNIIRQLGKEKVTILKEIKDFRKGIHQLEWENKRLDMEAEDWVNKTREFQLLRVTKNLQELIKGGGDQAKQAQEVAQLENRLKHGAKLHEEHVKDKKTYVAKLDRQSQDKTYENSSLEERMHIMELNVVERQHIHALAVKPETQNVAEKRYKAMVTRRKLLEIAHAQSDEIELLREQLDALRQRTFPSFATA